MNSFIKERVLKEANYMLETKKTIREIAKIFKISKSTIHKDLHERLFYVNKEKYQKVKEIMNYHLKIRHIRGGESTRKKYLTKNNSIISK